MPEIFNLIPWRQHILIFTKSRSIEEALFYINKVVEGNWSRNILEHEIKSNLYNRQGEALTNFSSELTQPHSDLAQEILKDPYNFDFLSMQRGYNEKQLEDSLAHKYI